MIILRAILWVLIHEFFWRLRLRLMSLASLKFRSVCNDLRTKGLAVIPNYYSKAEYDLIVKVCKQAASEPPEDPGDLSTVKYMNGSFRVKKLQERYTILKRFASDYFLIFLNLAFAGRPMLPSLQYQMTDSEEIKEAISQQKEVTLFGGNYHIDQIRHQLKVIVPLSVITTENGPTCFMLGSNRIVPSQYDYYLRKFQAKYYKDQKDPTADVQPDIYDNDLAPESIPKLEATNEIVLVTGGPGDLVLFDTRTFHKASAIKEGTREVLWMYF